MTEREDEEPINMILDEEDKDAAYTGRGANYRREKGAVA